MGGASAHLVHILLLQDASLFGGITLALHLLYDESATGHLTNGWSLHLTYCASLSLGKGIYSQPGNMHWKVDENLKYLINFPKRKYSLEI